MRARLSFGVLFTSALLWFVWPWLRPQLWPAAGASWLVVLDGYHRLDTALDRQARSAEPILLITCPATGQPSASQRDAARGPLQVVRDGADTAGQAVLFAHWLQQQSPARRPRRVLLFSDRHHFPRAAWAFQLAAGSSGTIVQSFAVDAAAPSLPIDSWTWSQLGPAWRDALRLQLWRATGRTGAWLAPEMAARKRQACGLGSALAITGTASFADRPRQVVV